MWLSPAFRWRLRSGAFLAPLIRVLLGAPYRRGKTAAPDISDSLLGTRKVLLIRLDEIGDVVLTTPLVRELRRNLPQAWITLVVKPEARNLVELCPYVDEILTFNCQGGGLLEPFRRHWRALLMAHRFLRRRHFDLAILPRWDIDWYQGTFLAYLSGAPRRVGFSEEVTQTKKAFNRGADRLLTQVFCDCEIKHEVRHNLDVIGFLGGDVRDDRLELWLGADDESYADELLRRHEVGPDQLLIAIGVGAGAPKRRWPLESYGQIGAWLEQHFQARLLIVGGPEDRSAGETLQSRLGPRSINAAGQTTLRQTAALLKRAALYLGNDAGPMHLAAAAGIAVVEISCHPRRGADRSANSPVRFGPWGPKCVIIQPEIVHATCVTECGASLAHCILGISVEQVKAVLTEFMSGGQFTSRTYRGVSARAVDNLSRGNADYQ